MVNPISPGISLCCWCSQRSARPFRVVGCFTSLAAACWDPANWNGIKHMHLSISISIYLSITCVYIYISFSIYIYIYLYIYIHRDTVHTKMCFLEKGPAFPVPGCLRSPGLPRYKGVATGYGVRAFNDWWRLIETFVAKQRGGFHKWRFPQTDSL